jgi:hypothetical protein
MYAFLGVMGALGFIVGLGGALLAKIGKRKNAKKWLIGSAVCFFIFIGAAFGEPSTKTNDTAVVDNTPKTEVSSTESKPVAVGKKSEPAAARVEEKSNAIEEGMYKVGSELPAGEYVLITDSQGYFQIDQDSTGEMESVLSNGIFTNRSIITVKDGQYITFKSATAYPYKKAPKYEPTDNILESGMYKVGHDLKPGEYKVTAEGQGYMEVAKNSTHQIDSVLSNDIFNGQKYIKVKTGQYIKLNNASLKLQ